MLASQPASRPDSLSSLLMNSLQSFRDAALVHLKNVSLQSSGETSPSNIWGILQAGAVNQQPDIKQAVFTPAISDTVKRWTKTSVTRKTLSHKRADVIVPSCLGTSSTELLLRDPPDDFTLHTSRDLFSQTQKDNMLNEWDFPPLCLWLPGM